MESKELSEKICNILSSKKARDIIVINVKEMTVIADYFVIASASSNTAVKALAEEVDDKLSEIDRPPLRMEGMSEGRWVAMDYGDVIVHIFYEETRKFYQLERLWTDGANVTVYED